MAAIICFFELSLWSALSAILRIEKKSVDHTPSIEITEWNRDVFTHFGPPRLLKQSYVLLVH